MKKCTYCGSVNEEGASRCIRCATNEFEPVVTAKPLAPSRRQYRTDGGHAVIALLSLFAFFGAFEGAVIGTQALLRMRGFSGYLQAMALVALLPLPLWLTLANLTGAPLLRLVGMLQYYSPMFLVTRSGGERLYLHGATLFDYALCMRWRDRGRQARRKTLILYIEGLLGLIQDIELGHVPQAAFITGTSYFFSARQGRRLGFKVEESRRFAFGGLLTYPTHFLTYSFAKGHWAFPNVLNARRASISGAGLLKQKGKFHALLNRLQNKGSRGTAQH